MDLSTTTPQWMTCPSASHVAALELAATSIDFELNPVEQRMLDRHLVACEMCRHTGEALRNDARMIASLLRP